jgi:hypothetical protein
MVAVVRMGMVMDAAGPVIAEMGTHDKGHGDQNHPIVLAGQELFGSQEGKTYRKQEHRYITMVVLSVAMPQGVNAYGKSQKDHENFEILIVDQFDPQ